jgi:hypothetical protein
MEEFVPCESLGVSDEDESTGERLTVPCEPFFSIPPLPLARAEDIERYFSPATFVIHRLTMTESVFLWMDMFPLESIRRVLHLLYPESTSWKFIPCEEEPLMKTITWTECDKTEPIRHHMGLFLFPPWVLSSTGLQEFARGQPVGITSTQNGERD